MQRRIIQAIPIFLCLLSLVSCKKNVPQISYQDFLKKLINLDVWYVDILYYNWGADVEGTETIDFLKSHYQYKITLHECHSMRPLLVDSLNTLSLENEIKLQNDGFRLACIFYDKNRREIYSLFFSALSPRVRIANKMYEITDKKILEFWVPFIPDVGRESFRSRIDTWFPVLGKNPSDVYGQ